MSELVPVILCGGKGSRLWPLSRESHPKQFVDLGSGRTLFGDALERGRSIPGSSNPIILTNERYQFFVRDELLKHDIKAGIICEPAIKNTAPAIALAALAILEEADKGEALMLILPSDHIIENVEKFSASVEKAKKVALKGFIVTFGIYPAYAATNYGYILKGDELENGVFAVRSFIEKPEFENAVRMLETGAYYWNAGIFLMSPAHFLNELKSCMPEIYKYCLTAWKKRRKSDGLEMPDKETFFKCPAISIDYAVMEQTRRAAMMPLDVAWNDLGSWDAFFKYALKDSGGNIGMGNIIFENCSHCQAYSQERLVAAMGVDDLNIIATADAVLISKNGAGEKMKDLLQLLKSKNLYHYDHHPRIYESWGNYERLAGDEGFEVSRLVINPGQGHCFQNYFHNAAHLIVIYGKAEVIINDDRQICTENKSVSIPGGCEYHIKNPDLVQLVLIQIRSGSPLKDKFGKTGLSYSFE